ncbi:M4 family metallopeptidase [Massilia sp. Dwa41.01b]|uniref:M4 family metallopeptidase n=1 Tax=unclassified Massilia TaxID=2609279 RepID=UPI0016005797|nr:MULTISPECIES: M4 family metallopeptidase [unclassified Massilia]QNA87689.1 M4 family metallopeptidase [Massilia sp. Dwa41.01b]QNA98591.1 M4 family metallopeptidase [Massilia sp. Se16.2.3]
MILQKTLIAAALALAATGAYAGNGNTDKVVNALNAERLRNGLDNNHGYAKSMEYPGPEGLQVTRLHHTYKGIRIFESESVVTTDARGSIVSQSHSERRDKISRSGVSLVAAISADAAIKAAVAGLGGADKHVVAPKAETIIFPIVKQQRVAGAANKKEAELNALDVEDVVEGYKLAYLVETRANKGNKPVYFNTVIDAANGAVLDQWSMLHTVAGTGYSQYNGTVPIQTTLSGTQYKMLDTTRGVGGTFGGMAITNANHSSTSNPQPGLIYTNASNSWGDGKQYISGGSTTNANGQTAAVNALWGMMNTYDTMKNVMGWRSLDGRNTATYIAVHVGTAYDNAFYTDTCRCMYIGDGNRFYSLGSIDVIGHEMGHGVTAATSNLTYRGESGGLNESSSDINGEAVEAYARNGGTGTVIPAGKNDWMMGKEISKTGTPLRWMWKPSKDGVSKDAWSTSLRNLDVHNSSGPNNRMFYFLSMGSNATSTSEMYSSYLTQLPRAMTGIGIDHAYRIWFRANTTKLTSSSTYADARAKMIAAATELYGAGSKEAKAVTRAYAAINVGADVAE